MIRDRGNIKWQGFFMPEHIKSLKQYEFEMSKEQKPVLDEQKIEEMNAIVAEGMEYNTPLKFKIYNKFLGSFEYIEGRVHFVDGTQKHFRIKDDKERMHIIPFTKVVDITTI